MYGQYFPTQHDDVIKWKHFPHCWSFVRGFHRWPVNFQHKGHWRGALMFFFYLRLNKRLGKHSWYWWFEAPSLSLWRHCNEWAIMQNGFRAMIWYHHRHSASWFLNRNLLLHVTLSLRIGGSIPSTLYLMWFHMCLLLFKSGLRVVNTTADWSRYFT